MIGHLQRNKARLAVELFDVIESLDNLALARELDKEGRRRGKIIRAFVEINLGGEESKSASPRITGHRCWKTLQSWPICESKD